MSWLSSQQSVAELPAPIECESGMDTQYEADISDCYSATWDNPWLDIGGEG